MVFQHGDIRVLQDLFGERLLYGFAGGVGGVNDAPMAVSTFTRQMKPQRAVVFGEGYATFNEPLDGFAAVLDDEARCGRIAQAGTGGKAVTDMRFNGIGRVKYCGDATLRPGRGRVAKRFFGHQCNPPVIGEAQGKRLAGQAAADHEDVILPRGGVADRRIHGERL